jgi:hypothetical protein
MINVGYGCGFTEPSIPEASPLNFASAGRPLHSTGNPQAESKLTAGNKKPWDWN